MKPHARQRMAERSVSEEDIQRALDEHFERVGTPKNSTRYRGPGVNGDTLKVWVYPDDGYSDVDYRLVKSVAWDGVDDGE